MMSAEPKRRISHQEYLAIERAAEYRSEYFDGEMFAMSGASFEHTEIASNLVKHFGAVLNGKPCRIYPTDLRVKIGKTGLYTYPDALIICGKRILEDDVHDTLLNATVLFEVLSKSTESYDRGKKFELYQKIDTLKEYVLIAQDRMRIERFTKVSEREWGITVFDLPEQNFFLTSVGVGVAVEQIYENVEFPEHVPLRIANPPPL